MRQRIPKMAWYTSGPAGHRPRVLVEDDLTALAISDFSAFEQAGFLTSPSAQAPAATRRPAPLLRGEECPVMAGTDVVLHGLDPRVGIAASIRRRYPGTPVLLKQRRLDDGRAQAVPQGCLPLTPDCSVHGQIDAFGGRWRSGHDVPPLGEHGERGLTYADTRGATPGGQAACEGPCAAREP